MVKISYKYLQNYGFDDIKTDTTFDVRPTQIFCI